MFVLVKKAFAIALCLLEPSTSSLALQPRKNLKKPEEAAIEPFFFKKPLKHTFLAKPFIHKVDPLNYRGRPFIH